MNQAFESPQMESIPRTSPWNELSRVFFVVGTVLLIPATTLLLDQYRGAYDAGIYFFIGASTLMMGAGALEMCGNRRRARDRCDPDSAWTPLLHDGFSNYERASKNFWRFLASVFNTLGGSCFLAASMLQLPQIENERAIGTQTSLTTIGTWVFRIGAVFYILGPISIIQSTGTRRKAQIFVSAGSHSIGATLFLIGGALNCANSDSFALFYILASGFFALAAIVNAV